MLEKLYHRNLKICQHKNLLLLPLLIIVFVYQLNGTKMQFLFGSYRKLVKEKIATYTLLNSNMDGIFRSPF